MGRFNRNGGESGRFAGLHGDAAEVDCAAEGTLEGGFEEVELAHGDAAGGYEDVDGAEGGAEGGFQGVGSVGKVTEGLVGVIWGWKVGLLNVLVGGNP